MAEPESPFDSRWRSFGVFQEEFRQRRVLLGVDRAFARRWMLRRGAGCSLLVQIAGYFLLVLAVVNVVLDVYLILHGAYLLSVFLLLLAYLSWRFFVQLAISGLRTAAMRDEALFRRWFDERRLSVFVKASGEYVWNDRSTA